MKKRKYAGLLAAMLLLTACAAQTSQQGRGAAASGTSSSETASAEMAGDEMASGGGESGEAGSGEAGAGAGKSGETGAGGGESGEGRETEAQEKGNSGEAITVRLGIPKAPPALPILRMMDAGLLGENVKLELDIWDGPEQLIAMVQDKDHQMFAFPLTVISKLYNKGLDVRLTNVNTWGVTYFVTTDPELSDWSQLKGKTVYIPLQSSPPDALTQFFMNEAGLNVDEDVEIIYSSTAEISQMLSGGQIEYATLIEPQVTAAMMKNDKVRVAFSFEEEWKRVRQDDSIVPNAGFGTTREFIEENPGFVEQFEKAYEEALNWVLENPQEAGKLAEEILGLKAELVAKAVPNMGLTYKKAGDAKAELDEFYQLLLDFDPEMIGGKLPDEAMYFEE